MTHNAFDENAKGSKYIDKIDSNILCELQKEGRLSMLNYQKE